MGLEKRNKDSRYRNLVHVARDMLDEGIYVIGFSYPVVPKGQARIRTQMSAAHSMDDISKAIQAFKKVGRKYNIINGQ